MVKLLRMLFPNTMAANYVEGFEAGRAKGKAEGFEAGEQHAGGAAVEMGEVIKSTLADPIRIGWAYKRALDGFGKFMPNAFYSACKYAAGVSPEELSE